ncbi:hypothetical protein RJ639_044266 [Escallonia herrerae]|uniref:Uncharacterized protein n=1 Tax=Escallonia herrerae TaxID=1293975 RepID=A0AA88W0Q1_9ASTE|nr:hypothetical protein RJ639_005546 [Escallonia herrerae]KAK3024650.1 hypothetical protein RJ639_044266 [Escallonia herrerae]
METLNSYISNYNLLKSKSTEWTREENKSFERALAIFDVEDPNRWIKVAAMIPGKSVFDVMKQYEVLEADISDIEAGVVPIPGYLASSFTLEVVEAFRKRNTTGRTSDQERRKGVPWTEDEHRRFLIGLQKHGKGDWRNISRNCVITKTPTQVASHAQKYFARQLPGRKDKRRPSIHDITTVHLTDITSAENNKSPSFEHSQKSPSTTKLIPGWNHPDDGAVVILDSIHGNPFVAYPCEVASHGLKFQRAGSYGANVGPRVSGFQIQSTRYQVRG